MSEQSHLQGKWRPPRATILLSEILLPKTLLKTCHFQSDLDFKITDRRLQTGLIGFQVNKMLSFKGLPGGPAVKTPHFHCRGAGSIFGGGTKSVHAARHSKKVF